MKLYFLLAPRVPSTTSQTVLGGTEILTRRGVRMSPGTSSRLVPLLLGFASVPWELFAIRSAHGLSMSLRDPSANALIAEHGGEKSVASAFAWYQTARTVAGSVSKAFAGILLTLTAANYPLVFFVAFALSVLPLLVVARYVKEESDTTRANRNPGSSSEPLAQRNQVETSASATQVRPKV